MAYDDDSLNTSEISLIYLRATLLQELKYKNYLSLIMGLDLPMEIIAYISKLASIQYNMPNLILAHTSCLNTIKNCTYYLPNFSESKLIKTSIFVTVKPKLYG